MTVFSASYEWTGAALGGGRPWLAMVQGLLVPIMPIICGDVSPGTQSLFGEFSPILDMVVLLSATAFREPGYLEFRFKTNHDYQLFVTGKGRKGMGAYDTSHLHLIMPPFSPTQTHTHSAHLLYSRLFFSEIPFESGLLLSDFSASFFR